METMIEPEIAAAARWWRKQLEAHSQQSRGDALYARIMTNLGRDASPLSMAVLDAFEAYLRQGLRQAIEAAQKDWGHRYPPCAEISVDYHPSDRLVEAALAAGIDAEGMSLRFPLKTIMHLYPGGVMVAAGYGAPFVTIYGKSEEEVHAESI